MENKRLNILLVNDDGIFSQGMLEMAAKLGKHHKVVICAPNDNCSGFSHHLHFHIPIFFEEQVVEGAEKAYSIEGTPADCVVFAVHQLKFKPDYVISGPNRGSNMATDIICSGTVAAAQEGAILGFKSISVSCCSFENCIWDTCCEFVLQNLDNFSKFDFTDRLLNINVPNIPLEQVKGVKITHQGIRHYDSYYAQKEIDGRVGYSLEGKPFPVENPNPKWDIAVVKNDYISITPLKLDRTDLDNVLSLEEIFK